MKFYSPAHDIWQDYFNYLGEVDGWQTRTGDRHFVLHRPDWLPEPLDVYLTNNKQWFGRGLNWQFYFILDSDAMRDLEMLPTESHQDLKPHFRQAFYHSLHDSMHDYLSPKLAGSELSLEWWHESPHENLMIAEQALSNPLKQTKLSEQIFWSHLPKPEQFLLNFYWRLSSLVAELQKLEQEALMKIWSEKKDYWDNLPSDFEKKHINHDLFKPLFIQQQKQQDYCTKGGRIDLYQNFVDSISKKRHFGA